MILEKILQGIPSEHPRGPVVAIAYLGNTPVIGWNSVKTSPRYRRVFTNGDTASSRHAEMHAIQQIPHDFPGARIKVYVTRRGKGGISTMARPCPHCQIALQRRGIYACNVFYTNWDGSWECLGEYDDT